MERFHLHLSRGSLHSLFASLERPDVTWKIVVWASVVVAIVIGTLGVLSYNWSIAVEAPKIDMKPTKTTKITATEIRGVIELYKTKQKSFEELQSARPTPPAVGGEAGVEVEGLYSTSPVTLPSETIIPQ